MVYGFYMDYVWISQQRRSFFFVFFGQVKTPHTSYAQDARELSGAGSVLRFLSAVSWFFLNFWWPLLIIFSFQLALFIGSYRILRNTGGFLWGNHAGRESKTSFKAAKFFQSREISRAKGHWMTPKLGEGRRWQEEHPHAAGLSHEK